jgi:LysR family transcriptional regulator for bpeEF and oprC
MTCATHQYLATHGTPDHPSDLESGHSLVGYFFPRSGRMRPLVFERDGRRIEVAPGSRVAVNDSSAHFASVRAGLGVGQLLAFMVSCNHANDEVASLLAEWQPPPMPVHALYTANRHLSTKVRVFLDWVATLFSQSPCTRLLSSDP